MKRSPIKRRTPLARGRALPWVPGVLATTKRSYPKFKPRADDDKVTPELHAFILARDGRCMAPTLDLELKSECADQYGNALVNGTYHALQRMHLDHVPLPNEVAMSGRAKSIKERLVVICPKHHLFGWATSKRGRTFERDYLKSLYPDTVGS